MTPRPTEKAVQHRVRAILAMMHVAVYDTSQPFAAKITPGVPDLLCFCKKRGFFVIEVKRAGGRQTEPQREFQSHCQAAGVSYVLGGTKEVADFLGLEWNE